ncbi:MAG: TonB C-terminal domain-containing protein [Oxalobacter sp.]|nr:MAG: TonB C-terminal domain-containing protein [Oxalobacter sp.]
MTGSDHYRIPKEPGGSGSLVLALLVHLALVVFLWIGVSWQSRDLGGVEAEIWDTHYREAAQKAAAEPAVAEEEEALKPASRADTQIAKADIALRQKKAAAKKQAEEEKRRKQEEKDRKKADAEKKKKLADEQRKRELAEKKAREEWRKNELRYMAGTSGTGGSGKVARSTGNNRLDSSYERLIAYKIRSNTVFVVPNNLDGNPAVEYAIELLPDGALRGEPQKITPSGLPGFDEAVLRAIKRSVPFPPDSTGKVPRSMITKHYPKDKH